MEVLWRVGSAAVLAAVSVLLVRRSGGEFASLISLAAGCLILGLCMDALKTVVDYLAQLRQTAQLDQAVMTPLLKTIGIGLVCKTAMSVCSDTGQSTLAWIVELCGVVLGVFACLPLFMAVLELLEGLVFVF